MKVKKLTLQQANALPEFADYAEIATTALQNNCSFEEAMYPVWESRVKAPIQYA